MLITPRSTSIGATVTQIDLAQAISHKDFAQLLLALTKHKVLCFPKQSIDAPELRDFSARFGSLQTLRSGQDKTGFPEVSVLSGNVTPGMTYERIKVVGKVGVNSDMDTGTMRPEFNGFCPPTRESTKRFPDDMTFQAVVVDVLGGEGEFVGVVDKV